MSVWLIGLVTIIYAWIAVEQFMKGNAGMSIAYAGYAFSNVGLMLLASR